MGTDKGGFGEFDRSLPSVEHFEDAPHAVVAGRCPATTDDDTTSKFSEFAVAVRKPSNETASTASVKVPYTIDGRTASTIINYGITLCDPKDTTQLCKDVNAAK